MEKFHGIGGGGHSSELNMTVETHCIKQGMVLVFVKKYVGSEDLDRFRHFQRFRATGRKANT